MKGYERMEQDEAVLRAKAAEAVTGEEKVEAAEGKEGTEVQWITAAKTADGMESGEAAEAMTDAERAWMEKKAECMETAGAVAGEKKEEAEAAAEPQPKQEYKPQQVTRLGQVTRMRQVTEATHDEKNSQETFAAGEVFGEPPVVQDPPALQETLPIGESPQDSPQIMRLEIEGRSCNEAFARVVVAVFTSRLDPTLEEIDDIKTAVSEAVTNAVIHGYENRGGTIYIEAALSGRELTVTVRDEGVGIEDVARAMEPMYTTDCTGERSGMGFAFMEAFMDQVEVWSEPGKGTAVTMKKRIGG